LLSQSLRVGLGHLRDFTEVIASRVKDADYGATAVVAIQYGIGNCQKPPGQIKGLCRISLGYLISDCTPLGFEIIDQMPAGSADPRMTATAQDRQPLADLSGTRRDSAPPPTRAEDAAWRPDCRC
jgi:hypothetical protein